MCGLTSGNYPELEQLYKKYEPEGLSVLGFPCNQFGGQVCFIFFNLANKSLFQWRNLKKNKGT